MLNKSRIEKYMVPLFPNTTSLVPEGKLTETVKAVLFDIYGTLFISGSGDISLARKEAFKIKELKNLLQAYNIVEDTKILLQKFFVAIENEHDKLRKSGIEYPEIRIEEIWATVLGQNDPATSQAFATEFEMIVNPVYPMPHLRELLSACKNSGIVMGIVSNAQFYTPYLFHWYLNSDLSSLGFHPDLTLFSYELGCAKPSPVLFNHAAERLKQMEIEENQVLYLGNDMLVDIFPAKTTGFITALFAGDARSLRLRKNHPQCKDLVPDLVITDLRQLVNYLPKP